MCVCVYVCMCVCVSVYMCVRHRSLERGGRDGDAHLRVDVLDLLEDNLVHGGLELGRGRTGRDLGALAL